MTNKTTGQLDAAAALAAADQLHIVQSGNSRRATMGALHSAMGAGWSLFVDAATALEASAVTIPANTRTLVTIDGGAGSIIAHANGSNIQWVDNEQRGVTVGDSYTWRLDFRAKKSSGPGTPAYITADMDISDGAGTFILAAQEQALRTDSVGHPITFTFAGYSLDTFAANGMRFYITSTVEIQVWAKRVFIRRDYHPFT